MVGLELTTVFNRHGDANDAQATLDHIAPDSLVFSEGHMAVPFSAREKAYKMLEIAASRLIDGRFSETSAAATLAMIDSLVDPSAAPATHQAYSVAFETGLLDKGCVLIPADYIELGSFYSSIGRKPFQHTKRDYTVMTDFLDNPSLDKIPKLVDIEMTMAKRFIDTTEIREMTAVSRVLEIQDALATHAFAHMALSKDGKLKAYIVYGDAHRNSLPRRLIENGVTIHDSVRVHDRGDSMDLDMLKDMLDDDRYEYDIALHYLDIVTDFLRQKALDKKEPRI